jgi:hypothetical protein
MWDKLISLKKEIIALLPATSGLFEGGCTSCNANKLTRKLKGYVSIGSESDEFKQLLEDIKAKATPSDLEIKPFAPLDATAMDSRAIESPENYRDVCLECVLKHLCQALVLITESAQGYPHHTSFLLAQLDAASKQLKGYPDAVALNVNHAAEKARLYALSMTGGHLRAAEDALLAALTLIAHGDKSRWKAIGHMGEAADECVAMFPALADRIRGERLEMMHDPKYKPPMLSLAVTVSEMIKEHGSDVIPVGDTKSVPGDDTSL